MPVPDTTPGAPLDDAHNGVFTDRIPSIRAGDFYTAGGVNGRLAALASRSRYNKDRAIALAAQVDALDGRVAVIETASPADVAAKAALMELYGKGLPFALERWRAGQTLIDHADLVAASDLIAVAGDDSADLVDQSAIELDGDYVVYGVGKTPQQVYVTAKLAGGRIRVYPDLTQPFAAGDHVGRHNFDLVGGVAYARAGGVYFSPVVDFGAPADAPRALVVRRGVAPAWTVRVYYRDAAIPGVWAEAPWGRKRLLGAAEDVEYLLPAVAGRLRLRVEVSVAVGMTAPADPLSIHHLYACRRQTDLGGDGNLPYAPEITYPPDGALGVPVDLVVAVAAFSAPTGAALDHLDVEIETSAGTPVWSGSGALGALTVAVPAGALLGDVAYRLRARVVGRDALASSWCGWSGFTAAETVAIPATPTITGSPSSIAVTATPLSWLQGDGTHLASQWRLKDAAGVVVWDSGRRTDALTSIAAPGAPLPQTVYRWDVRYETDTAGWTGWAPPVSITTGADEIGAVRFNVPGLVNWIVPSGVTAVSVVCVGGGGGSAYMDWSSEDDSETYWAGGGGAVAYADIIATTPGGGVAVSVGAQGWGANSGQAGGAGGATSFASVLTAGGGGGAVNGAAGAPGVRYGGDGGGDGQSGGAAGLYVSGEIRAARGASPYGVAVAVDGLGQNIVQSRGGGEYGAGGPPGQSGGNSRPGQVGFVRVVWGVGLDGQSRAYPYRAAPLY